MDITLKQYELIYRIVASVGRHFSHGAGKSCQFYNVNGALILSELLKVNARPVMGAAFIALTNNKDVLSFAGIENGELYSNEDAFHCWVETPSFYIDFTAPEYREATDGKAISSVVPRKMFQKNKKTMSTDPYQLDKEGDFYFQKNEELTRYLLTKMASIAASEDFSRICIKWFKDSRKNILPALDIVNDLGQVTKMSLLSGGLQSAW